MKLARAKEKINELDAQISKFVRDNPYSVTRKDDANKARHIIQIEMSIMPDPIGCLVGEFAYNLRSGLDHLAWQLALLTTKNPSRNTAFPICASKPTPTDDLFKKKVVDIPQVAVNVIESLQPYHRGTAFKDHPLWKLNKLCNMDKHQVIAISNTVVPVFVGGVTQAWKRELTYGLQVEVPLSEKENIQFKPGLPQIVFGEPIEATDAPSNFEITFAELGTIYDFLRHDAVPQFERFFP